MTIGRPPKYLTPEERRAARNAQTEESKRRKREAFHPHGYGGANRAAVPPEVLAEAAQERARLEAYQPTLTQEFFGDPPPWRSALNRKIGL